MHTILASLIKQTAPIISSKASVVLFHIRVVICLFSLLKYRTCDSIICRHRNFISLLQSMVSCTMFVWFRRPGCFQLRAVPCNAQLQFYLNYRGPCSVTLQRTCSILTTENPIQLNNRTLFCLNYSVPRFHKACTLPEQTHTLQKLFNAVSR